MMGHPRVEDAIRLGLAGLEDVDAVFRSLGELGLSARLGLRRARCSLRPTSTPSSLDTAVFLPGEAGAPSAVQDPIRRRPLRRRGARIC
jgi:hypothetical protein